MQNPAVTPFWFCFNSTLVQLKARKHPYVVFSQISFNSTLVQLKDKRHM